MTVFEFTIILWSIMFSIAIAHMLASVADLVRVGGRVKISGVHALWMLSVFVCVLANWLSVWDLRLLTHWTTGYILFLTLATVLQYFACVLISPPAPEEGAIDLRAFHQTQGPRYLAAFALLNFYSIPLNILTAQLFGVASWGWQSLAQGPAAALTLLAIFAKPRWAQWALAVAVLTLSAFYLTSLQGELK
ncbi:MAG: hypothetical protein WD076_05330 [Parvularculaceae bacterium]